MRAPMIAAALLAIGVSTCIGAEHPILGKRMLVKDPTGASQRLGHPVNAVPGSDKVSVYRFPLTTDLGVRLGSRLAHAMQSLSIDQATA